MAQWAKAINGLDGEAVKVAFQVLGKSAADYRGQLHDYVYGKVEGLFRRPSNDAARELARNSRLESAIESLAEPVTLDQEGFRRLVAFVRHSCRDDNRNRAADIRHLARLREKIPDFAVGRAEQQDKFVAALTRLVERGQDESADLAFTLLEAFGDRERYLEAVTTQLASAFVSEAKTCTGDAKESTAKLAQDYRNLVTSSLAVAGLDEKRGWAQFRARAIACLDEASPTAGNLNESDWLSNLMLKLFVGEQPRFRCLQLLADVASLPVASIDWREALFQVARSRTPEPAVGDYVYLKLIPRALQDRNLQVSPKDRSEDLPKELSRLFEHASGLFAEDRFELLVRELMRTVDAASDRERTAGGHVRKAVWLSQLCPAEDPRRELLKTVAEYRVAQAREPFCSMWTRTCYGSLLVPVEAPLRQQRCRQMIDEIQRLYNEDSGKCPAGTNEDVLPGNLKTVRAALDILTKASRVIVPGTSAPGGDGVPSHSMVTVPSDTAPDYQSVYGRELTDVEAELIHAWWSRLQHQKSFSAYPDIPREKWKMVSAAYGIDGSGPILLGLQDSTFFGSARAGLVATAEGLYWKSSGAAKSLYVDYLTIRPEEVRHYYGVLACHILLDSHKRIRLRRVSRVETLVALATFIREAAGICQQADDARSHGP